MSRFSRTERALNYDINNALSRSSQTLIELTSRLSFICYRMKLSKSCNEDCINCPLQAIFNDYDISRKDLE